MITNKEISKSVLEKCKGKDLYFNTVTEKDIENILNYYGRMILYIIKRGGFITLPTYRNKFAQNCIRVVPIERRVVFKTLMRRWLRLNHMRREEKVSQELHQ